MCGALEFQDGGVISAAGGKPNADARSPRGRVRRNGGGLRRIRRREGAKDSERGRTRVRSERRIGRWRRRRRRREWGYSGGRRRRRRRPRRRRGGGGGRIALLSPETWPPSVTVAAGGGRSGGACGTAGFHGAAGTVFNVASGALSVSNLDVTPDDAERSCAIEDVARAARVSRPGSWGACATTRLEGALPLRGVASLRIADAAVACTDACPRSNANEDAATFGRGLLGGADSSGMGGAGGAPGGVRRHHNHRIVASASRRRGRCRV